MTLMLMEIMFKFNIVSQYNHMHEHLLKNHHHWQPYHFLEVQKYCTHWQEQVPLLSSLVAAVVLPLG